LQPISLILSNEEGRNIHSVAAFFMGSDNGVVYALDIVLNIIIVSIFG
jgi:hypothetical protein